MIQERQFIIKNGKKTERNGNDAGLTKDWGCITILLYRGWQMKDKVADKTKESVILN